MLLTSVVRGTVDSAYALPGFSVYGAALLFFVTYLLGILTHCIYNLFFHPLRSYPGPLLWRAARLPYVIRALQGRLAYDVLKLHERYGPMIRVAPNELALAYEGVWDEVQGGTYETEMQKWKPYYRVQPDQIGFIFTAPPEEHSKMRRTLSYGFSDRGIRDLEPRMIEVLDKMMRRLLDICGDRESWSSHQSARVGTQTGEAVVDITEWLNFLTFDMIGELTFGESYECLEKASYHPWVKPVVELTHYSGILANLGFYPKFQGLLLKAFGGLICRRMEFHQKHSRAALERRAAKPNRSDLLSEPLKQTQASLDPIAWDELVMNASSLVVAGAETSATTVTAALWFLLTNPGTYQHLRTEVRSAFKSRGEITLSAVNNLEYMLACLNETMRMLPAVPGGLPRVVPCGGRVLGGGFVPQGTIVASWHWALYHNNAFFKDPFEFRPERFLGAERFASDARQLIQPFHVGRRACIGRSLAYAEMRLILACLVFDFDIEMTNESRDWLAGLKPYNLWYKEPLYVRIKARKSED